MGPVRGFAPGRAEGYYKPITIPSVRACPLCVIRLSSSSSAAVSTVDDAQGAAGRAGTMPCGVLLSPKAVHPVRLGFPV